MVRCNGGRPTCVGRPPPFPSGPILERRLSALGYFSAKIATASPKGKLSWKLPPAATATYCLPFTE